MSEDLIKIGSKSTLLKAAAIGTNAVGEMRTETGIVENSIVGMIPEPHFSSYVGAVGIFGNRIKGVYNHPVVEKVLPRAIDYCFHDNQIFLLSGGSLVRCNRYSLRENLVLFSNVDSGNRNLQLTNCAVAPDGSAIYALLVDGYVRAWSLKQETLGERLTGGLFSNGLSTQRLVDFYVGDETRRLFFFNEEGNLVAITTKNATCWNLTTKANIFDVNGNDQWVAAHISTAPSFTMFTDFSSVRPIYVGKRYAVCQRSTAEFSLLDTTTGKFKSASLQTTNVGTKPFFTTEIRDAESWNETECVLLCASGRVKVSFSDLGSEFTHAFTRPYSAIKKLQSGLYVAYNVVSKELFVLDSSFNVIYTNKKILEQEVPQVNAKALVDYDNGLFGFLNNKSLILVNPLLELGGYLMTGGE